MARPETGSNLAAHKRRLVSTGFVIACAAVLTIAPIAQAATSTNAWMAKIGSGGANGTATIQAFTTGTGSIALKLTKLKPSTTLAVTLLKTSCSGSTIVTLPSVKTASTGAVARTSSLSAGQVATIKKATAGAARMAIRIGAGTSARCGVFLPQIVPPYVAANVTVGRAPSGVAIDPSGVWVTSWLDNTLSRIDPVTNTVLSVVPLQLTGDEGPEAIVGGGGSLWLTTTEFDTSDNALPGSVLRVDPASGAILASINGGRGSYDIAYGLGAVWVPAYDDNSVLRIDPATNQIAATIPVRGASGVAIDASAVWVVGADGAVSRIDPATNQIVATIHTQGTGAYIAVGAGAIWVTNPGTSGLANGSLTRIDPATNQIAANTVLGSNPEEVVVAGGSVWVGMYGEHSIVRVSPATNAVINRIPVMFTVYSIDASAHAVWAVHNLPRPDDASPTPPGHVSRINY